MLGLPMAIHVGTAGQCRAAVRALRLVVGRGFLGELKRHRGRVGWGRSGSGLVGKRGRGDLGNVLKVEGIAR